MPLFKGHRRYMDRARNKKDGSICLISSGLQAGAASEPLVEI